MKKTGLVILTVLALLLLPAPLAPDEALAADAAQAQAQQPPASPEAEQELEEYVPSQKVSLDASISFPVDI
jgi:hypothetical protein